MGYNLTAQLVTFDLLVAYVLWYSAGYNCEKLGLFRLGAAVPIAVRGIVRVSFGAAISVPILFIGWILNSPQLAYAVFYLASTGLMVSSIAKNRVSLKAIAQAISQGAKHVDPGFLALMLFLIWLLGRSVSYSNWPPAGDIMWAHGPLVSLIESLQKIPSSWAPLAAEPINYPPGFHATVASFNLVWNILPAQAVFVVGAASLIMVVLMLASIIKLATFSTILALVGGLCSMYVSSIGRLELWLFGYFYNGPYPNLYAFLLLLLGMFFLIDQTRGNSSSPHYSLIVSEITLTASLVIIYPPFALYTALFAVVVLLKERAIFFSGSTVRRATVALIVSLSLIIAVLLLSIGSWNFASTVGYLFSHGEGYYISASELLSGFSGVLLIAALVISSLRIAARKRYTLHGIYLILFALVSTSTYPPLYRFVSPILPVRSYVFLYFLSIIIVLGFISTLESFLPKGNNFLHRRIPTIIPGLVCAMLLASVAPSVWFIVSGTADQNYLWFGASESFKNDLSAMIWLRENVPANQLILNDLSFSSEYLSSVATLDVAFSPVNINGNFSGAKLFEFWIKPSEGFSANDLISAAGSQVSWTVYPSWGQGNIGTPGLVQLKSDAFAATVSVPAGQNGFWGVSAEFNKTIDLSLYPWLTPNVTSSYPLGLSLIVQDNSKNYARYDFVSDNFPTVKIQLDKPSGSQGVVNMSAVVGFAFLTGYLGPFPTPNETVAINGFDVSKPNPNLATLLHDFDVRYVLVTSEWGMYPGTAVGGNDTYVAKPYTPTEYVTILNRLPFLTPVFISGNSVVYRVQL